MSRRPTCCAERCRRICNLAGRASRRIGSLSSEGEDEAFHRGDALRMMPSATVTRRDLGHHPIPHATANYATRLASPALLTSGNMEGAVCLSEELIQEVEAADILVIGTPMNNFTIPSVLKSYIDQIVRIGRTFTSTSEGKAGLLHDRPVFVAIASGGKFYGEHAGQPDFLTPYLTAVLGCIGLKTLHFLPLQATAFLSDEQALTAQEKLLAPLCTVDLPMTSTPSERG